MTKYRFELSCDACPEQYDVFEQLSDGSEKNVAYVRLRHGRLTVSDEPLGEEIYSFTFSDYWKGAFDDEIERKVFLEHIENVIREYYHPNDC